MTLKLNVLITISAKGKTFSVWSDTLKELPWINLHEGHGSNLSEAIDDFYMSLPDKIIIDDDINIQSAEIYYLLKRPYKISYSESIRIFKVN
jgi:hypothetical protein